MNNIKAAFFAHAANLTGSSRSMIDLTNALKNIGVTPIVILPTKGPIEEDLKKWGTKYYIIPYRQWVHSARRKKTFKKRFNHVVKECINYSLYPKTISILKKENVQVIHSNNLSFGFGAQIASAMNIPHVWHMRDFMEEDHHITFYDKKKAAKLMREAKHLIAISDIIAKKFSEFAGRDADVIYNGVPIDLYKIDNKKLFSDDKIHLMIAGRIIDTKGQKEAIEAVEILKDKYPNLLLKIIGQGTPDGFEEKLKDYVTEKKLSQWVEFVPFQSDMTPYRKECDIQLICSWNEAFGRVTVEGMLSRAVIVGADAGCTPYLIKDGETGFLYQCKDAQALADKIEYVITHQSIAPKMTAAAFDYAVEKFDIARVSRQVKELYEKII